VRAADRHLAALALDADLQPAVPADRRVVLADLEVLRQVGVEVVLPVEPRLGGDLGVERLADSDRTLHRGLVDHRERAREAETDGAGPAVRLLVLGGGRRTSTEDLGVRFELDVDLQPDDDGEVGAARGRLRAHTAVCVWCG
jgi:hypothetical protein